jgi:predicted HicB family RNase H-like nuclease
MASDVPDWMKEEAASVPASPPPTPKEPLKRFNVELPASLHAKLKIRAIEEGCSLRELAEKVFREYLAP